MKWSVIVLCGILIVCENFSMKIGMAYFVNNYKGLFLDEKTFMEAEIII